MDIRIRATLYTLSASSDSLEKDGTKFGNTDHEHVSYSLCSEGNMLLRTSSSIGLDWRDFITLVFDAGEFVMYGKIWKGLIGIRRKRE